VQEEIQVHFLGLVLAASLFTLGILAFVYTFVQSGRPLGEVDAQATAEFA
jgi:nitric oxide reductase subunit B